MANDTVPGLTALARPGAEVAVQVTPRAARAGITVEGGLIRVRVTVPPEDGKANLAVRDLLAQALGVARTRLVLIPGATSRDKRFRLD